MQPSRRRRIGRGQNIAAGLVLLVASVLVMAIVMSQYVAGSGSSLPSTDTQGSAFLSESAFRGGWPRPAAGWSLSAAARSPSMTGQNAPRI